MKTFYRQLNFIYVCAPDYLVNLTINLTESCPPKVEINFKDAISRTKLNYYIRRSQYRGKKLLMNYVKHDLNTHQNLQWLPWPMHVPSQTQWWSNWRTHLSQSWQCFARGGCRLNMKRIITIKIANHQSSFLSFSFLFYFLNHTVCFVAQWLHY